MYEQVKLRMTEQGVDHEGYDILIINGMYELNGQEIQGMYYLNDNKTDVFLLLSNAFNGAEDKVINPDCVIYRKIKSQMHTMLSFGEMWQRVEIFLLKED